MAGWIKINRKIVEHWLWQDAERLKWWLDLLFMASWEDKKVSHDTHLFTLHRGQLIASISFLSDRWGKSNPTIIKYLKMLENDGMIKRETLYRYSTVITICKYEDYQCDTDSQVDSLVYTLNSKPFIGKNSYKVDSKNLGVSDCKSETPSYKESRKIDSSNENEVDSLVYTNKEYNNIYISSSLHSEDKSDSKSDEPKDKMDLSKFVIFWNSEMERYNAIIPKLRTIQGKRKNYILARCRECGKEAVAEMVRKAAQSDFLNGKNQRGWIANFDWVILPTNFQKVLEGNYDNHSNNNQDGINQQDGKVQRKRIETKSTSSEDYEGTF